MSQDDVVRALGEPGFYPHRPETVEHVQTHISHLFLAGPFVYKLKKAVRFPFLDFSTVERRRFFCIEEVRLNRRLSAPVYLDVMPIVRRGGGLALGGDGDAVDHVVRMRRLPADRMLAVLLERGAVCGEMLETLAGTLAAFHAAAPGGPAVAVHAAPQALRERWEENVRGLGEFVGRLLPAEDHEVLGDFGPTFIAHHETLLRARQQSGHIREGHGDLHAQHVCFVEAPAAPAGDVPPLPAGIYVFDCIEFSQALRCNDVAYEVAFLAMDLESLGHAEAARRFTAAYATAAADPGVALLLNFYACHLAAVRGKVEGLASVGDEVASAERERAAERARRHLALALRYAWSTGGPAVIACCGLSGTGKTTLARELAAATGFTLLGSDAIRRRVVDEGPSRAAPYGTGRYTPAAREAVYETLCTEADAALEGGTSVIADATFIRRADRERLARVARAQRRPLVFLECVADKTAVRSRLEGRARGESLSDAGWDTYVGQREEREPFDADEPHLVVDTSEGVVAARQRAVRVLWRWRQGRPPSD